MFRRSSPSRKTDLPEPLVINLAEGLHFESRENYRQLLEVIEGYLYRLGLASPDLLLTGYDGWHDDHPETPKREATWALPLSQVRDEVERNPDANNPFVYAQVQQATYRDEPTIAAYDPTKLHPISGHPELHMKYAPTPGQTLEVAKLVEFPISFVDPCLLD